MKLVTAWSSAKKAKITDLIMVVQLLGVQKRVQKDIVFLKLGVKMLENWRDYSIHGDGRGCCVSGCMTDASDASDASCVIAQGHPACRVR